MGMKGLPLAARVEITKKYATAYVGASKKQRSRILDQLVSDCSARLTGGIRFLSAQDGREQGASRDLRVRSSHASC